MILYYKSFIFLVWIRLASGTIQGLSYMDPIGQRPFGSKLPGEDPCNPLYWYPRTIPEYCYFKPLITNTRNPPLPVPLPVPVPPQLLIPVPQHLPLLPMPLSIIPPAPPIVPPPALPIALPSSYGPLPMVPPAPISAPASLTMGFGTNLQSHFPFPHPVYEPQAGLVPGLPGLVTKDGGINIMPFSDAYADILENHKNKMIRKKLQRILNEYEHFPNSMKYSRIKKLKRLMDL